MVCGTINKINMSHRKYEVNLAMLHDNPNALHAIGGCMQKAVPSLPRQASPQEMKSDG